MERFGPAQVFFNDAKELSRRAEKFHSQRLTLAGALEKMRVTICNYRKEASYQIFGSQVVPWV